FRWMVPVAPATATDAADGGAGCRLLSGTAAGGLPTVGAGGGVRAIRFPIWSLGSARDSAASSSVGSELPGLSDATCWPSGKPAAAVVLAEATACHGMLRRATIVGFCAI